MLHTNKADSTPEFCSNGSSKSINPPPGLQTQGGRPRKFRGRAVILTPGRPVGAGAERHGGGQDPLRDVGVHRRLAVCVKHGRQRFRREETSVSTAFHLFFSSSGFCSAHYFHIKRLKVTARVFCSLLRTLMRWRSTAALLWLPVCKKGKKGRRRNECFRSCLTTNHHPGSGSGSGSSSSILPTCFSHFNPS